MEVWGPLSQPMGFGMIVGLAKSQIPLINMFSLFHLIHIFYLGIKYIYIYVYLTKNPYILSWD